MSDDANPYGMRRVYPITSVHQRNDERKVLFDRHLDEDIPMTALHMELTEPVESFGRHERNLQKRFNKFDVVDTDPTPPHGIERPKPTK